MRAVGEFNMYDIRAALVGVLCVEREGFHASFGSTCTALAAGTRAKTTAAAGVIAFVPWLLTSDDEFQVSSMRETRKTRSLFKIIRRHFALCIALWLASFGVLFVLRSFTALISHSPFSPRPSCREL